MYIAIKGNETTRRDFLSIIRANFEKIHQSLPGLVPEIKEYIALPNNPKNIISYKYLLDIEAIGDETYRIPDSLEKVNVTNLLNGFENESSRRQRQLPFKEKGLNIEINNNNFQHNPMENKNTNQAISGDGNNVVDSGEITAPKTPNPQPSEENVTKKNTKALKNNTLWVIIGTIVTILGLG